MPEQKNHSEIIGLTSTIPVEIIFAAGLKPVDLNNIFINSLFSGKLVSKAESAGFSHNICAWIKGIYSVVINDDIKNVIAVTGGDCSNTIALAELLSRRGVLVINFDYPLNRDGDLLMAQMDKLRRRLSTTWSDINSIRFRLAKIRTKLRELDRLTFQENLVTGLENHLFLVSSSDFKSDPDLYERELDEFLLEVRKRRPKKGEIRIGYIGVPPIFGQFYEYIESLGARVVFNEIQRQFSMPYESEDIIDMYLNYTYPYEASGRIEDIKRAIEERELDGLIHYTQTFCYRQIYDIVLRESLSLPILTLEGDRPGPIDGRTAIRLETFIEMLKDVSH
ncbi:MAG: 2-hydroxyacyl-CoA dehydratase [Thermodesulfobacteriota bacterium]|nr:2-hydroxyacyl-CoA dehydratase [Thermodesulfobacteriota bacterium]